MKIVLAQLNACVGDIQGNTAKIRHAYDQAVSQQADLVVSPELFITGYPPEDLLLFPSFQQAVELAVDSLAQHTGETPLVVGTPWLDGNKLKNAALVLRQGTIEHVAAKCHLPNYGPFDEQRYFAKHAKTTVIDVNGLTVGLSICEDLWATSSLTKKLVQQGAQIIINLSASPYHTGKPALRHEVFGKRAKSQQVPILMCNLVGGQDELVFDGHSCAISADGQLAAAAPGFEESALTVDLDPKTGAIGTRSKKRATPHDINQEQADALCLGLRDYVDKNGFQSVLIGMSGGIDSALVGALALRALGPDRIEAVSMPSRFNSSETRSDARTLCQNLGINFREISISSMFAAALESIAPHLGSEQDWGVTSENIQARTRGQILMSLSNRYSWLVVTTGNKSELAMGYATLYGDMVGGFSLIKDLTKSRVYALSRWLIDVEGMAIPESILTRAPSAELRENQTDQDSLPPYDVLDPILECYIEKNMGLVDILKEHPDKDMVASILKAVDRSEYKRRQAAPGPRVTQRVFGKDRRMPITQRWDSR